MPALPMSGPHLAPHHLATNPQTSTFYLPGSTSSSRPTWLLVFPVSHFLQCFITQSLTCSYGICRIDQHHFGIWPRLDHRCRLWRHCQYRLGVAGCGRRYSVQEGESAVSTGREVALLGVDIAIEHGRVVATTLSGTAWDTARYVQADSIDLGFQKWQRRYHFPSCKFVLSG